jgi:ribosome-associated toxin RatA of RatAB toxin-antitoxin module
MIDIDAPPIVDEDLKVITDDVSLTLSKLEGRQRRVEATIHLAHPVEAVWQVLSDYDRLSDFIPNLAKSCKIPHPEGGVRIEQVGAQNLRIVTFTARVVLDMAEEYPSAIRFNMVEGDFKGFSGAWLLQRIPGLGGEGTLLTYTLDVWPKATIPVIAIEQRLKKDLPQNLHAIRDRLSQQN